VLPGPEPDRLPELTVLDLEGETVRLADVWAERPVILAFVRHFG
jgi:hypothetical protein